MLGISVRDRILSIDIHDRTNITEVVRGTYGETQVTMGLRKKDSE